MHRISLVSLSDLDHLGAARRIRDILRNDFLLVEGHGASEGLMDDAEGLTTRLFTEWPLEELEKRYGHPEIFRQRALTAQIGLEQAAAEEGKPRPSGDLKVFGMFRYEEWPENMEIDAPYGLNIWPDDILPELRPVLLKHMEAQHRIYIAVLVALETAYGFSSGALVNKARGAESMLRNIFYPGLDLLAEWGIHVPEDAQASAPHGDINAATVLRINKGLWIRRKDETWAEADASRRGAFGVNVGEMIAKVEGIDDDLIPTIHCVGAPPGIVSPGDFDFRRRPRTALPYFGHFRHSTSLRPGLKTGDWFRDRIGRITRG